MRSGKPNLRLGALRPLRYTRLLPVPAFVLVSLAASADFRLPDLDGDGRADVVLRHDDGTWRHFATGDVAVATERPAPIRFTRDTAWHPAAVGDFNGDGRDDFLLRRDDGRWGYYPMNGARVIAEGRGRAALTTRREWRPVGAGDLNGDGRDDVLLRHDDGRWLYYPMDGKHSIVAERGSANLPTDPAWRMAAVADFDGDARDDVLLRHHKTGSWRVYRMQGHRVQLSYTPTLTKSSLWRAGAAGDFNGDGRTDMLLRHADGRWMWQSPTVANAGARVPLPVDWRWRFAGLGDLDGDGSDDVLIRHDDGAWRSFPMDPRASGSDSRSPALPADSAWSLPAPAVYIPDPPLRAAVENHLGKAPGERITRRELAGLTEFRAPQRAGIADLAGLRHASGLTRLFIDGNHVDDLMPLAGLTSLKELWAVTNRIEDLAPVVGLPNLERLWPSRNRVTDISPLVALGQLTRLNVSYNPIADASPLASLQGLRQLHIDDTGIADLRVLATLRGLRTLTIDDNQVTDISPLAQLRGLDYLSAENNRIDDIGTLAALHRLTRLHLDGNPLEDLGPLANLAILRELTLNGTRVTDLQPLANLNRLWRLHVSGTGISDLAGIENLRLGDLDLSQNRIADIAPLSDQTFLWRLDLRGNRIENLFPLVRMTRLQTLRLDRNRIRSVTHLKVLTRLTELGLAHNEIVDLVPLWDLLELVTLHLDHNRIVDVAPLARLVKLRRLNLAFNRIEDLSPLARNTGLGAGDTLDVRGNPLQLERTDNAVVALRERGVEVQWDRARILGVHDNTVVLMSVDADIAAETAFSGMSFDTYASTFFTHFEDQFDYLLFFSNLDSIHDHEDAPYYGVYLSVMNDTAGLGINTFYRSDYGSAGRLRGVVHFPYNRALRNGPALHELQHAWSNFVVDTGWPSHWGFSSAHGQLGGFDMADFNDLGDGRYTAGSFGPFANGGNRPAYSPIELYYAGFIPPEEVPDLHVAEDGAWLIEDEELVRGDDGHGVFTASGVTTYTIQDLIAKHGPRVPSMADAQWHHRAALVLLVDDDHPATEEQLATLVEHAAYMSHPGNDDDYLQNFHEATGGRGSISFDLAGAVKAEESPPANLPASFGVVPPPRFTSLDGHCRTLHQH